jgi:hypothetical protein
MGLYQLCYRIFYRQIFKFSKRLPEKFSSSLLPQLSPVPPNHKVLILQFHLKIYTPWFLDTYYSLVKGVLQFGQSKVEHGTPG